MKVVLLKGSEKLESVVCLEFEVLDVQVDPPCRSIGIDAGWEVRMGIALLQVNCLAVMVTALDELS